MPYLECVGTDYVPTTSQLVPTVLTEDENLLSTGLSQKSADSRFHHQA